MGPPPGRRFASRPSPSSTASLLGQNAPHHSDPTRQCNLPHVPRLFLLAHDAEDMPTSYPRCLSKLTSPRALFKPRFSPAPHHNPQKRCPPPIPRIRPSQWLTTLFSQSRNPPQRRKSHHIQEAGLTGNGSRRQLEASEQHLWSKPAKGRNVWCCREETQGCRYSR